MITANDIVKANEVLKNVVERTPLDFDRYLSEKYGATIYIKKENMQKVRSFKLRGAYYAIHQLSDEDKARGVVCASAGNHAQGVAYTCNEMRIPATIFMPVTTPLQKIGQVRFFGGKFVTIIMSKRVKEQLLMKFMSRLKRRVFPSIVSWFQ